MKPKYRIYTHTARFTKKEKEKVDKYLKKNKISFSNLCVELLKGGKILEESGEE